MFWNQTFDQDVECSPEEIRALFEDELEVELRDKGEVEEPTLSTSNSSSSELI